MTPNPNQPLRVAVVASSLRRAGAEKQTVYLTRALSEADTDTRFFHLGEGGPYEAVLRQMKIPFVRIYRPNRPIVMLARLAQAFCRFRPDIVFAPQFSDLLQGGTAGRLCNALVLGGLRSDGFYELNTSGPRSRWMLRLAHGLVANSHCARQNLMSQVAAPPGISILPNVLDLREFDACSRMPPPISVPGDRIVAVAVGSLQPSKRFDRFLEALALARQKAPALLGIIAGADCGSKTALEHKAKELGLAPGHVAFLGECDNIPALLAQAGFLVLCSEYEGFPNVILEAMAARLPVISARVGDAERIVLQNQTGFLVDGADLTAMARRMAELAGLPAIRTRLGTEGRTRAALEYNYESLSCRLLKVFREFATQNGRRKLAERLQGWFANRGVTHGPEGLLSSQPAG
jgi:glycosyltransferase involved in cell wall biosynthesis